MPRSEPRRASLDNGNGMHSVLSSRVPARLPREADPPALAKVRSGLYREADERVTGNVCMPVDTDLWSRSW